MTVYDAAREPRLQPRLRIFLTAADQVAIVGALTRDLKLPDVDHQTIRDLLARLARP